MPTPQKIKIVEEMTDKFSRASSFFMADFTGVDVNTVNELRQEFFDQNVEYRIVKNTLAKLSLDKAGIDGFDGYLKGVNAYAISYDDPTTPIRIIKDFKKKKLKDKLELKAAFFEGQVIEATGVEALANLPTKQELLGQLVGMLASPMTKLARTLQAPMSNTVGVLKSLEEKKQG